MLDDCVVILGSGLSINSLTDYERDILNHCPIKISINKFGAFYKKAGITPTHVFFTDDYYQTARDFFRYLVSVLRRDKLSDLTFIVSQNTDKYMINRNSCEILKRTDMVFKNLIIEFGRRILIFEKMNPTLGGMIRTGIGLKEKYNFKYILSPRRSIIHGVTIKEHLVTGSPWAKNLSEPLYHYKGSISTVFNYVSIMFPKRKLILVGTDFNSSDYFFEKELAELHFDTKDWTYEIRKSENKHYSIIETDGQRIDYDLPYMIEQLSKTGNQVVCINPDSFLVQNGYVKYQTINELV